MRTFVSADGPFQMLLGMTSITPTKPAHVTFPGLMGNFIRTFLYAVRVGGSREETPAATKT